MRTTSSIEASSAGAPYVWVKIAARIEPGPQEVLRDGGRLAPPAAGRSRVVASLGDARRAVERDPRHQLRRPEVAGRAAHLPDALVRDPPRGGGVSGELANDAPRPVVDGGVAEPQVPVDEMREPAPDVVLALVDRAIADAHGPRAFVAVEMVEGGLGQLPLPTDAIHHLQRRLVHPVGDESQEGMRLVAEAQVLERGEGTDAVTDPGVAVVPVPAATGRLRQGGGRRSHGGTRGCVDEALEGQRGALQEDASVTLRDHARGQPVAPEAQGGGDHVAVNVQGGVALPGKDHDTGLAGMQLRPAGGRPPGPDDRDVAAQPKRADRWIHRRRAIVGCRHEVDIHDDRAGRAGQRADQPGTRPTQLVDHERIGEHERAGVGPPGRLEHEAPREVPAGSGLRPPCRAYPEVPGPSVEDRPDDARAVHAREAEPLDGPGRRDQRGDDAIGQEPERLDGRVPGCALAHPGTIRRRGGTVALVRRPAMPPGPSDPAPVLVGGMAVAHARSAVRAPRLGRSRDQGEHPHERDDAPHHICQLSHEWTSLRGSIARPEPLLR